MHIAHVQGSLAPEHGGPTHSTSSYARGQAALGHRVGVWVLEGQPNTSPALRLPPPVEMHVYPVGFPVKLGRSAALKRELMRSEPADVYHLHGAWLRAMYYGAAKARAAGRPYLVEPQGTYEPYAIGQRALRKTVARRWFQDAMMRGAACLHVNSVKEAESLRELGFRAPMVVLPAGVDTKLMDERVVAAGDGSPWPVLAGRPFLLFLSRVHKNKGIEPLMEAWARLAERFPDFVLAVAGPVAPEYERQIRQLATDLGLADRWAYLGQVSDVQRSWLYKNAFVYILPSFSENFGNTVPEAMAHGTPVVATPNTPWGVVVGEGCGWIAEPTADSLEATLSPAVGMSRETRDDMGRRGRALVERKYSLAYVVNALTDTYRWVRGEGPAPDDVFD